MQSTPNFLEHDDIEMDIALEDRQNDGFGRGMAAAGRDFGSDAMEIDLPPTENELSPDNQNLPWVDYLEPLRGRQLEDTARLWSLQRENDSTWLNEALDSEHNSKNLTADKARATCGACLETVDGDDLITVTCGCHYCKACLNKYIENGLANRGSFPPRCCGQETVLDTLRAFLDARVTKRYEEVQEEFSSRNPTYCAGCGAFLPGAVTFADFKACQKCLQQTCIRCKNLRTLHEGSDKIGGTGMAAVGCSKGRQCPGIEVPSELTALITKEEWSRCPSCRHVVEKTEGCDFME
jgi:hypothetical protein